MNVVESPAGGPQELEIAGGAAEIDRKVSVHFLERHAQVCRAGNEALKRSAGDRELGARAAGSDAAEDLVVTDADRPLLKFKFALEAGVELVHVLLPGA